MTRTLLESKIDSIANAVAPKIYQAKLAEDYDGIGQYALVALSPSSTSLAYRARVSAGDAGNRRLIPSGTPVTVRSYRGSLEILSFGQGQFEGPKIIGEVPGGQIGPGIPGENLEPGSITDVTPFASTIRLVKIVTSLPALPDPDYPITQPVILTTDGKLYRNFGDVWTAAVPTVDLSGVVSVGQLSSTVQGALADDPTNMLVNGGGEQGTLDAQADGWVFNAGSPMVVADDESKYGSRSLKITNATAIFSSSKQGPFPTKAGRVYVASCWMKTGALPTGDAGWGATMNLSPTGTIAALESVGDLALGTGPDVGIAATGAPVDWRFVKRRFRAVTDGDCSVEPDLGQPGLGQSGTAWWDGFRFAEESMIVGDEIVSGAVTTDKMTANTIDGDRIQTDTLHGNRIEAGTVAADRIEANSLTAGQIAAGAIAASEVAAEAISAGHLAALLITARNIEIQNGHLIVRSGGGGSTVIIDGTSNMFKIAATGEISGTYPAVNSIAETAVQLTALGSGFSAVTLQAMFSVAFDSTAGQPRFPAIAIAYNTSTGVIRAFAEGSIYVTGGYLYAKLARGSLTYQPTETAACRYYIMIEAGI